MRRSTHSPEDPDNESALACASAQAYDDDGIDFEDVGFESDDRSPSNYQDNADSNRAIVIVPQTGVIKNNFHQEDVEGADNLKTKSSLDQTLRSAASTQSVSKSTIVPPDNTSNYNENRKDAKSRRSAILLTLIAITLLILAIAIGVGISIRLKEKHEIYTNSQIPTTFPTRSPTLRPPSFSNTVRLPFPRSSIYDACDLLNVLQEGTAERCRSLCAIAVECCIEDRRCRQNNKNRCEEYFGPCVALEMLGD